MWVWTGGVDGETQLCLGNWAFFLYFILVCFILLTLQYLAFQCDLICAMLLFFIFNVLFRLRDREDDSTIYIWEL